jgi:hypothetical protein
LTSFSNISEATFERDCDEEATRVFDLAYNETGDEIYAFIQSARWRSNCNLENSTSTEVEIIAP